jgi:hypothetical protein
MNSQNQLNFFVANLLLQVEYNGNVIEKNVVVGKRREKIRIFLRREQMVTQLEERRSKNTASGNESFWKESRWSLTKKKGGLRIQPQVMNPLEKKADAHSPRRKEAWEYSLR